jgi:hypothetical protein
MSTYADRAKFLFLQQVLQRIPQEGPESELLSHAPHLCPPDLLKPFFYILLVTDEGLLVYVCSVLWQFMKGGPDYADPDAIKIQSLPESFSSFGRGKGYIRLQLWDSALRISVRVCQRVRRASSPATVPWIS